MISLENVCENVLERRINEKEELREYLLNGEGVRDPATFFRSRD